LRKKRTSDWKELTKLMNEEAQKILDKKKEKVEFT